MRERTSTWSLRARLLSIALFALVSSLLFGGAAMYWAASLEENQATDARLEHFGATVLSFVDEGVNRLGPNDAGSGVVLKTRPAATLKYRFQVWSRNGDLLLRSHEAPADRPLMPLSNLGFDAVRIDGEQFRTFALPNRNRELVVQVAENIDEHWTQTVLLTLYYVGFLLVPLGLVFVVTAAMLRRSLSSVATISDQFRNRNPLDLRPVEVENPPRELLPMLRAVDTLFARVGQALSAERRFTSVAAHEMRTPLAGLRAHAQLATTASSPAELQDALKSLMSGADRTARLIEQLLDLARIEGAVADASAREEAVSLPEIYRVVMRELGPRGARKQLVFESRFAVQTVSGHTFALTLLLHNLLGNCIHYTPAGGRVEVSSALLGDTVLLCVDDSGPGIPAHAREHAFERFNRLGQSQVEGVGLGLSIVLSVVNMHGARIELLESPLGGLRVQMLFGRASAAPVEPGPIAPEPGP